ncbi:hypothetical protein WAI453_006267 [Rhynchosporium graminicola]
MVTPVTEFTPPLPALSDMHFPLYLSIPPSNILSIYYYRNYRICTQTLNDREFDQKRNVDQKPIVWPNRQLMS